jgi:integrase
MTAQPLPALTSGDPSTWDQALYAFLVEKGNRSGSRRTVESYSRMLWPFFAERSLTPDRVKPGDVLAWVHGIGRSGRTPSPTTVGARIACLSSFYRFLIRMGLVVANPCDAVERPRTVQSVARGYSADEVRRLLAVVPDTVAGRRDRALLLTFILTGRRRTEVIGLTAGDISIEGETVFYAYRGKGGKRGRRELPRPAYEALCATLADAGLEPWLDAQGGFTVAGGSGTPGRDGLDLLRQVPPLPWGGRPSTDRNTRPTTQCREAPPRRRRVDRVRQLVLGPQLTRGHERLPQAARGRHRSDLAGGRAGDRTEPVLVSSETEEGLAVGARPSPTHYSQSGEAPSLSAAAVPCRLGTVTPGRGI